MERVYSGRKRLGNKGDKEKVKKKGGVEKHTI